MSTATSVRQGGTLRQIMLFSALTLGVVALVASSVSATSAYFSDVELRDAVVATGEVDISLSGLGGSLDFEGDSLMPGESVSQSFTVTNEAADDGNVDLYVWLEFGSWQGVDLCDSVVDVAISGPAVPGAAASNDICDVAVDTDSSLGGSFPNGTAAPLRINTVSSPLGSNPRTYEVTLTLDSSAGNALADFTSDGSDQLVVYAVQAGAPAPNFADFDDYEATDVFTQQ